MNRREFLTAVAAAIGPAAALDIAQATGEPIYPAGRRVSIEPPPDAYDYGFYVIEPGLTMIGDNPPSNRMEIERAHVLKMPRPFAVERVGIMPYGDTLESIIGLLNTANMQVTLNEVPLFPKPVLLGNFPLVTNGAAACMPIFFPLRIGVGSEIKFTIERDAPAIADDPARPAVRLFLIGRHEPA